MADLLLVLFILLWLGFAYSIKKSAPCHIVTATVGGLALSVFSTLFVGVGYSLWHDWRLEKQELRTAISSGFNTVEEYRKARAAGASTLSQYYTLLQQKERQERAAAAKRAADEQKALQEKADEAKRCQSNFSCWAQDHKIDGIVFCSSAIELSATYGFRWGKGFFTQKFPYMRPGPNRTIVFSGDNVAFQNGFGAWQNQVYICTYDPASKRVSSLEIIPGKLSR